MEYWWTNTTIGFWPATWLAASGCASASCDTPVEEGPPQLAWETADSWEGAERIAELLKTEGHQTSPCSSPPSWRVMRIRSLERRQEGSLSAVAASQTLKQSTTLEIYQRSWASFHFHCVIRHAETADISTLQLEGMVISIFAIIFTIDTGIWPSLPGSTHYVVLNTLFIALFLAYKSGLKCNEGVGFQRLTHSASIFNKK